MGNIANEAKLLKLDGKAYRSDFMLEMAKAMLETTYLDKDQERARDCHAHN